jgi:hypothetical protein
MRQLLIAALLATAASAQIALGPAEIAAASKRLEPRENETALRCEVEPTKPALNFGLRFQAGYLLRVPLIQYPGSGHTWNIVLRVTPEGGAKQPVYLGDHIDLPPTLRPDALAETSGTFLLGEGRYGVSFAMSDDSGRVCRKQWQLEAEMGRGERTLELTMPPGMAGSLSWSGTAANAPPLRPNPRRLTVLVNSSAPYRPPFRPPLRPITGPPPFPARDAIADYRATLLGILSALLEQFPGTAVRLVVFDLDQQREILREESFTLADMHKAAHAANDLEHWAADYHDLQNQPGQRGFIARLIDSEIHAQVRADLVLFLGPRVGTAEKMPREWLRAEAGARERFLYLQYNVYRVPVDPGAPIEMTSRGGGELPMGHGMVTRPELPDGIAEAVARLKGKTLAVHTPVEFAKAIEEIRRTAAPRARAPAR